MLVSQTINRVSACCVVWTCHPLANTVQCYLSELSVSYWHCSFCCLNLSFSDQHCAISSIWIISLSLTLCAVSSNWIIGLLPALCSFIRLNCQSDTLSVWHWHFVQFYPSELSVSCQHFAVSSIWIVSLLPSLFSFIHLNCQSLTSTVQFHPSELSVSY